MTPVTEAPSTSVRVLAWLAGLWLAFALVFLTDASCFILIGFGLAFGWLVLVLLWAVLAAVEPAVFRCRASRRRWLAAGTAAGLGVALATTDVGLVVRVALCQSALVRYAEQVGPDSYQSHEWRRVGLFLVDGHEQKDGIVYLYTSQSFLDREGIAYIPAGTTAEPFHQVRHLFGPWYWCMQRF